MKKIEVLVSNRRPVRILLLPFVSYKMSTLFLSSVPASIVLVGSVCQFLLIVFLYAFMKYPPSVAKDTCLPTQAEARTEALAPIRVPRRQTMRNLRGCLADGQPVRHRLRGHVDPFLGTYDGETNRIVCADGTSVKSFSQFAVHNMRLANPNLVNPQANGWTRCEVQIEDGSWVKANTLVIV
jgi:hypothetical protein